VKDETGIWTTGGKPILPRKYLMTFWLGSVEDETLKNWGHVNNPAFSL